MVNVVKLNIKKFLCISFTHPDPQPHSILSLHRALYNLRNFLHHRIPPFQVLFITMKNIFHLLILSMLFLYNVKVESFV